MPNDDLNLLLEYYLTFDVIDSDEVFQICISLLGNFASFK